MASKKHHKFSHSHIEYHHDGSATAHHVHESDPKQDVRHAVADHDGLMDSMMDHTSAPNPGEAEANAGPAPAAPAGIPGAAPAGMPGPVGA
jgi:hypothetical protein